MYEEEDVLNKAKNILSLEKSIKDSRDKMYIETIRYLFTKGFTETSLSLPITKREKESFKYLKTFVNVLDILFKKDEKERHKLYQNEIISRTLGSDIFNLIQGLKTISDMKKLGVFEGANLVDLNICANYIFCNYLKSIDNTLSGALNLYFYYLGYMIKSVDTFNLLLYYFLEINDVLRKFEYKDFCPDLKSSNCLNLIILFFESVVKEPMEILTIYALLILKYKYIFQGIDDDIEKSILKKSVEESVYIVKEKTLNNKIILEYIFNEFLYNLNFNLNSISLQLSDELKIEEIYKDYQKEVDKNDEGNKIIEDSESKNNLNEESIRNKNEITYQINISGIINNNKDKSEVNISNNEEYNKKRQSHFEDNIITNVKENNNSKTIDNNSDNRTIENGMSNLSINGQKENSCLDKSIDDNKSERIYTIEENREKNIFNSKNELNKSPEIQKLIDEINKMKRENNEREEKSEKRFKDMENKLDLLENKNNILKKEINETKAKMEDVYGTLSLIQLRDRAKNFLKSFNIKLDKKDEEAIKQKKKTKWQTISEKIKEKYKKYENSNKYKAFVEIVEKSAETIDKGNEFVDKIKMEYYENNTDRFNQQNQK